MFIKTWIRNQYDHFQKLSKPERSLLLSFFLFGLAAPIIYTFSNTFLWRQGQDPVTLILFNSAFVAVIPFGFLINALVLKISDTPFLYFIGCALQGLVPIFLVLLGVQTTSVAPLLGAILGLAGGFYWANRNYLTSKISQGEHRLYFISMEGVLETIANIVAPITVGWLLIFGQHFSLYSIDTGYRIAALIAFVILLLAGRAVWMADLPPCTNELKQFFLRKPASKWNRLRVVEAVSGIVSGIEMIIPTVIILSLLGTEETVGTIETLTAIASALILFLVSKRINHKHHLTLLGLWFLGSLLGSTSFAVLFSAIGAIIYFICNGLFGSFRWASLMTIMYEIVDQHAASSATHRFVYIMDREFFLSVGRLAALGLLFAFYTLAPTETLRYGLLLVALAQAILLVVIRPLTKHLSHKSLPTASVVNEPTPGA